ncbi:DUF6114 domain-containing protein [Smaragdicoccus niigatensis]|uniref:DUF6114 domain-containing protein n=1 Tax=Smaragdicoccus niigatensis TaxID=359359 RepID=UPI00036882A5|nr:DUF6114 domain-containing protein [Smaragdicoccus niigatensis]
MLTLVKGERAQEARDWFRDFRRTRPFWGGLWMVLGGSMILRVSAVSLESAVSGGITGFGGWMTGGGLIICGLLVWAGEEHRFVAGIIGLLLAIASLVVSNLGGFFIGMLFGIIGGAMAIAWGPKPVRELTEEADG